MKTRAEDSCLEFRSGNEPTFDTLMNDMQSLSRSRYDASTIGIRRQCCGKPQTMYNFLSLKTELRGDDVALYAAFGMRYAFRVKREQLLPFVKKTIGGTAKALFGNEIVHETYIEFVVNVTCFSNKRPLQYFCVCNYAVISHLIFRLLF
jgi:hypothetical protein